ncbi:MAG: hypothetical protein EOL93_00755 [Epsilonproteobacteria bacterium]|nr:hypothetical protein [Campylobacterota bacterium]
MKIENCSLTADVKSQAETIAKNNVDIRDLQTSLAKKRSEINLQNKLIEQNKIDKEAKDKEVKTQKEEIDKKYKLKREEIQRYKGDENASSCDNARMFFNSAYW